MDLPEPPSLQPLGGLLLLAGLFVLRELVSGALKEAGKDAWTWVKEKRSGGRVAGEAIDDAASACEDAEADRGASNITAIGPGQGAASDSRRKSA